MAELRATPAISAVVEPAAPPTIEPEPAPEAAEPEPAPEAAETSVDVPLPAPSTVLVTVKGIDSELDASGNALTSGGGEEDGAVALVRESVAPTSGLVCLALGGNAGTVYSLCNAAMITGFNVGWRHFALFLCTWENYRLQPRYREMLTYKLFIFQCINCYFTLLYTAFFKPFGVRLFGVDMGRCEVRPLAPGEPSCADEVRQLLYAVLFANILVGQATEVGIAVFGIVNKRIVSALNDVRTPHPPLRPRAAASPTRPHTTRTHARTHATPPRTLPVPQLSRGPHP